MPAMWFEFSHGQPLGNSRKCPCKHNLTALTRNPGHSHLQTQTGLTVIRIDRRPHKVLALLRGISKVLGLDSRSRLCETSNQFDLVRDMEKRVRQRGYGWTTADRRDSQQQVAYCVEVDVGPSNLHQLLAGFCRVALMTCSLRSDGMPSQTYRTSSSSGGFILGFPQHGSPRSRLRKNTTSQNRLSVFRPFGQPWADNRIGQRTQRGLEGFASFTCILFHV
ncbi:hypothetical protein BU23DRAFT_155971 [Bimuria novae-zelandiae CBS 107.79]|uniref:Uncharacterized protein n=1 Tax=Bimuria novae-zelandiae CBS 107.79 TaxID=1447943 RepID=A0A6A5V633_9PLEO|nr:hypothetical protein BU23DRAFT_155971 [Bimuria novae-zelandiae CBS 107.79]